MCWMINSSISSGLNINCHRWRTKRSASFRWLSSGSSVKRPIRTLHSHASTRLLGTISVLSTTIRLSNSSVTMSKSLVPRASDLTSSSTVARYGISNVLISYVTHEVTQTIVTEKEYFLPTINNSIASIDVMSNWIVLWIWKPVSFIQSDRSRWLSNHSLILNRINSGNLMEYFTHSSFLLVFCLFRIGRAAAKLSSRSAAINWVSCPSSTFSQSITDNHIKLSASKSALFVLNDPENNDSTSPYLTQYHIAAQSNSRTI